VHVDILRNERAPIRKYCLSVGIKWRSSYSDSKPKVGSEITSLCIRQPRRKFLGITGCTQASYNRCHTSDDAITLALHFRI